MYQNEVGRKVDLKKNSMLPNWEGVQRIREENIEPSEGVGRVFGLALGH